MKVSVWAERYEVISVGASTISGVVPRRVLPELRPPDPQIAVDLLLYVGATIADEAEKAGRSIVSCTAEETNGVFSALFRRAQGRHSGLAARTRRCFTWPSGGTVPFHLAVHSSNCQAGRVARDYGLNTRYPGNLTISLNGNRDDV